MLVNDYMEEKRVNLLDYCILGVVGWSIVSSYFRGFWQELWALFSWCIAGILAYRFQGHLAPLLSGLDAPWLQEGTAFILLFCAVLLVGCIAGKYFRFSIRDTGLAVIDSGLGMVFGALRGLLIASCALAVLAYLRWLDNDALIQKSKFYPYVRPILPTCLRWLPPALQPDNLIKLALYREGPIDKSLPHEEERLACYHSRH